MTIQELLPVIKELESRSSSLVLVRLETGKPFQLFKSRTPTKALLGLLIKLQKDMSVAMGTLSPEELFAIPEPLARITPSHDLKYETTQDLLDTIVNHSEVIAISFQIQANSPGLYQERFSWAGDPFRALAIVTYAIHVLTETELQERRDERFSEDPEEGLQVYDLNYDINEINKANTATIGYEHEEEGFRVGYRGDFNDVLALTQITRDRLLESQYPPEEGTEPFEGFDEL